jgi:hypothetical protein
VEGWRRREADTSRNRVDDAYGLWRWRGVEWVDLPSWCCHYSTCASGSTDPLRLGKVDAEVRECLFDSVSEAGGQTVDEAKGGSAIHEAKRTGFIVRFYRPI